MVSCRCLGDASMTRGKAQSHFINKDPNWSSD